MSGRALWRGLAWPLGYFQGYPDAFDAIPRFPNLAASALAEGFSQTILAHSPAAFHIETQRGSSFDFSPVRRSSHKPFSETGYPYGIFTDILTGMTSVYFKKILKKPTKYSGVARCERFFVVFFVSSERDCRIKFGIHGNMTYIMYRACTIEK